MAHLDYKNSFHPIDFIAPLAAKRRKASQDVDVKLSYSKQLEVTKELKKIWIEKKDR